MESKRKNKNKNKHNKNNTASGSVANSNANNPGTSETAVATVASEETNPKMSNSFSSPTVSATNQHTLVVSSIINEIETNNNSTTTTTTTTTGGANSTCTSSSVNASPINTATVIDSSILSTDSNLDTILDNSSSLSFSPTTITTNKTMHQEETTSNQKINSRIVKSTTITGIKFNTTRDSGFSDSITEDTSSSSISNLINKGSSVLVTRTEHVLETNSATNSADNITLLTKCYTDKGKLKSVEENIDIIEPGVTTDSSEIAANDEASKEFITIVKTTKVTTKVKQIKPKNSKKKKKLQKQSLAVESSVADRADDGEGRNSAGEDEVKCENTTETVIKVDINKSTEELVFEPGVIAKQDDVVEETTTTEPINVPEPAPVPVVDLNSTVLDSEDILSTYSNSNSVAQSPKKAVPVLCDLTNQEPVQQQTPPPPTPPVIHKKDSISSQGSQGSTNSKKKRFKIFRKTSQTQAEQVVTAASSESSIKRKLDKNINDSSIPSGSVTKQAKIDRNILLNLIPNPEPRNILIDQDQKDRIIYLKPECVNLLLNETLLNEAEMGAEPPTKTLKSIVKKMISRSLDLLRHDRVESYDKLCSQLRVEYGAFLSTSECQLSDYIFGNQFPRLLQDEKALLRLELDKNSARPFEEIIEFNNNNINNNWTRKFLENEDEDVKLVTIRRKVEEPLLSVVTKTAEEPKEEIVRIEVEEVVKKPELDEEDKKEEPKVELLETRIVLDTIKEPPILFLADTNPDLFNKNKENIIVPSRSVTNQPEPIEKPDQVENNKKSSKKSTFGACLSCKSSDRSKSGSKNKPTLNKSAPISSSTPVKASAKPEEAKPEPKLELKPEEAKPVPKPDLFTNLDNKIENENIMSSTPTTVEITQAQYVQSITDTLELTPVSIQDAKVAENEEKQEQPATPPSTPQIITTNPISQAINLTETVINENSLNILTPETTPTSTALSTPNDNLQQKIEPEEQAADEENNQQESPQIEFTELKVNTTDEFVSFGADEIQIESHNSIDNQPVKILTESVNKVELITPNTNEFIEITNEIISKIETSLEEEKLKDSEEKFEVISDEPKKNIEVINFCEPEVKPVVKLAQVSSVQEPKLPSSSLTPTSTQVTSSKKQKKKKGGASVLSCFSGKSTKTKNQPITTTNQPLTSQDNTKLDTSVTINSKPVVVKPSAQVDSSLFVGLDAKPGEKPQNYTPVIKIEEPVIQKIEIETEKPNDVVQVVSETVQETNEQALIVSQEPQVVLEPEQDKPEEVPQIVEQAVPQEVHIEELTIEQPVRELLQEVVQEISQEAQKEEVQLEVPDKIIPLIVDLAISPFVPKEQEQTPLEEPAQVVPVEHVESPKSNDLVSLPEPKKQSQSVPVKSEPEVTVVASKPTPSPQPQAPKQQIPISNKTKAKKSKSGVSCFSSKRPKKEDKPVVISVTEPKPAVEQVVVNKPVERRDDTPLPPDWNVGLDRKEGEVVFRNDPVNYTAPETTTETIVKPEPEPIHVQKQVEPKKEEEQKLPVEPEPELRKQETLTINSPGAYIKLPHEPDPVVVPIVVSNVIIAPKPTTQEPKPVKTEVVVPELKPTVPNEENKRKSKTSFIDMPLIDILKPSEKTNKKKKGSKKKGTTSASVPSKPEAPSIRIEPKKVEPAIKEPEVKVPEILVEKPNIPEIAVSEPVTEIEIIKSEDQPVEINILDSVIDSETIGQIREIIKEEVDDESNKKDISKPIAELVDQMVIQTSNLIESETITKTETIESSNLLVNVVRKIEEINETSVREANFNQEVQISREIKISHEMHVEREPETEIAVISEPEHTVVDIVVDVPSVKSPPPTETIKIDREPDVVKLPEIDKSISVQAEKPVVVEKPKEEAKAEPAPVVIRQTSGKNEKRGHASVIDMPLIDILVPKGAKEAEKNRRSHIEPLIKACQLSVKQDQPEISSVSAVDMIAPLKDTENAQLTKPDDNNAVRKLEPREPIVTDKVDNSISVSNLNMKKPSTDSPKAIPIESRNNSKKSKKESSTVGCFSCKSKNKKKVPIAQKPQAKSLETTDQARTIEKSTAIEKPAQRIQAQQQPKIVDLNTMKLDAPYSPDSKQSAINQPIGTLNFEELNQKLEKLHSEEVVENDTAQEPAVKIEIEIEKEKTESEETKEESVINHEEIIKKLDQIESPIEIVHETISKSELIDSEFAEITNEIISKIESSLEEEKSKKIENEEVVLAVEKTPVKEEPKKNIEIINFCEPQVKPAVVVVQPSSPSSVQPAQQVNISKKQKKKGGNVLSCFSGKSKKTKNASSSGQAPATKAPSVVPNIVVKPPESSTEHQIIQSQTAQSTPVSQIRPQVRHLSTANSDMFKGLDKPSSYSIDVEDIINLQGFIDVDINKKEPTLESPTSGTVTGEYKTEEPKSPTATVGHESVDIIKHDKEDIKDFDQKLEPAQEIADNENAVIEVQPPQLEVVNVNTEIPAQPPKKPPRGNIDPTVCDIIDISSLPLVLDTQIIEEQPSKIICETTNITIENVQPVIDLPKVETTPSIIPVSSQQEPPPVIPIVTPTSSPVKEQAKETPKQGKTELEKVIMRVNSQTAPAQKRKRPTTSIIDMPLIDIFVPKSVKRFEKERRSANKLNTSVAIPTINVIAPPQSTSVTEISTKEVKAIEVKAPVTKEQKPVINDDYFKGLDNNEVIKGPEIVKPVEEKKATIDPNFSAEDFVKVEAKPLRDETVEKSEPEKIEVKPAQVVDLPSFVDVQITKEVYKSIKRDTWNTDPLPHVQIGLHKITDDNSKSTREHTATTATTSTTDKTVESHVSNSSSSPKRVSVSMLNQVEISEVLPKVVTQQKQVNISQELNQQIRPLSNENRKLLKAKKKEAVEYMKIKTDSNWLNKEKIINKDLKAKDKLINKLFKKSVSVIIEQQPNKKQTTYSDLCKKLEKETQKSNYLTKSDLEKFVLQIKTDLENGNLVNYLKTGKVEEKQPDLVRKSPEKQVKVEITEVKTNVVPIDAPLDAPVKPIKEEKSFSSSTDKLNVDTQPGVIRRFPSLTWREANERARILFYKGRVPSIHYNEKRDSFRVSMLTQVNTSDGQEMTTEVPVGDEDVRRLLNSCGLYWNGESISLLNKSDEIFSNAQQEAFDLIQLINGQNNESTQPAPQQINN